MRATDPCVTDVITYLQALVDNEVAGIKVGSYSAVRAHVAAINVAMQRRNGSKESYDLHANKTFEHFLASIKRGMPPESKYDTFFDPDVIFEYILANWADNSTLDVTTLRTKTMILFRMYGFNRSDDIAKCYKEETTITTVPETGFKSMTYRFGAVKNTKAMRTKKAPPKFTGTSIICSPLSPRHRGLSLPHTLEELNKRTSATSAVIGPLDDKVHGPPYHGLTATFSSVTKQARGPKDNRVNVFTPLTANTIGNKCLQVMRDAGVDTAKYKAHALRGASGNKFQRNGGSKANWLAKTRHCNESTLEKFYVRDIEGASDAPIEDMPKLPAGHTDVDIQLRFVGLARKGAVTRGSRKRAVSKAAVSHGMTS